MGISLMREEKQYFRLFLAGVVNGIGDRFSSIAILAMTLNLTGSGLAVGITLAIRVIPSLLFGPVGGMLADRFSRKSILITTDLFRILFALSFLFVHSKEDLWIVYFSSFILASGEAIYAPSRKSSIPQLVNKENLVKVNSLEQVMVGIILIIGALSGGIVSAVFGPDLTFWFNAVSFLGAAIINSTITFPVSKIRNKLESPEKLDVFSTFKKVMIISFPVQILLFCNVLIASINGIDNVLISVYAVKEYRLGDIGVGLFYGVLGIGLMLNFSIANRLRKHFLLAGLICLLFEGIFQLLLSRTHFIVFALLLFCGAAFMSGVGNACFDTVLMKEIDEQHQGIMFGLLATISNTILGISMFLVGAALHYVEPRTLGLIGGTAYCLIAMFLMILISTKVQFKKSVN